MRAERWAVLGGGFLGMTLALRLAQHQKQVTLFETAPALGGLASTWNLGDIVWDRHYHVTLLSDSYLRRLLRELDVEKEMQWVETRTGFYTGGRLYSMSNLIEFLSFPALNLIDKFRLGTTILYASRLKNWKPLEEITAAAWLEKHTGRRTLQKIWLPLLRAKLGENYDKASAAFIWAIIARMYAARKEGLKKEMFGYVCGGYARVLECFGKVLNDAGVELRLSSPISKIRNTAEGTVEMTLANGTAECFDQAALTMAPPLAERLCDGLTDAERSTMRGVDYQGIICASVLIEKPLAGYYVTNITDDGVPFTAVIEMSALVDRKNFGGLSLVYLPKYVPSDSKEFELSDSEIEKRFLGSLEEMYPQFNRSQVKAFKISRVRYVFPIPTLHYSEHLPPVTTSMAGVHIINSAHIVNGTLNVNETIRLAERMAEYLLSVARPASQVNPEYAVH